MMNKRLLALAAAGALAIAGLTVAKTNAAEPGRNFGGRGPVLQKIIGQLDLTDDQLTKIKAELRNEKENIAPLLEKLHEARKGLRETIQSNGDEKAVRSAHAKVAAVEADLAVIRARLHGKITPILTDDQIAKAKEMEEKFDEFVINALKGIGAKLGQN